MPVAVVNPTIVRKELETCEGGWVDLRRMNYGQKLRRSEMAANMSTKSTQKQMEGRTAEEEVELFVNMLQRRVTELDFKICIVDHNLTNSTETKLDFTNPQTLDLLDPRIGEEISAYIDALNNFEANEVSKEKNSETVSSDT